MQLINLNGTHTPEPMLDLAAILEFARQLARDTGEYLTHTQADIAALSQQTLKYDGSVVTTSDIESDRRITAAILQRFPSHTILSEERDRVYAGQEWCWIIDPIDGTSNFASGYPIWGVLIGLLHYGVPVLGVADFPLLHEQFYAAKGLGAWRNGLPIRGAAHAKFEHYHLLACCSRTFKHGDLPLKVKARVAGSSGYDLASVACGRCAATINMTVHVWDVAACWVLLNEAGGFAQTTVPNQLFPLKQGIDYASVEFAILAAGNPTLLAEANAKLSDRVKVSG